MSSAPENAANRLYYGDNLDIPRRQWWALELVSARPTEQKKGATRASATPPLRA